MSSSSQQSRSGKDSFSWDKVKSDKDRECYLGHSVMAPTGRWQEGKDLNWYSKDRENEKQMKSAEFLAAKRMEEQALMAALGVRTMAPPPPPVAAAPSSSRSNASIKREPQTPAVKNEPMTPAIHSDPRNFSRQKQDKRKEDRRRRRQIKATASDEEKNDWSEDDDDLIDQSDDEDEEDHAQPRSANPLEQGLMTEKELDEFLVDLVKKHGFKTIHRVLKSKKEKKESKHKRSSSSSSESEEEKEKTSKKHKHKKKHSNKDEKKSSKRQRTRSPSPPSKKDRSKHHRH